MKILIGEGAYGKIYKIANKTPIFIEKHIKLINCGTLTEIAFYKKYCSDKTKIPEWFPILYNIYHKKKSSSIFIVIEMSYEGNTLDIVSKELVYVERIAHLPEMIKQFGLILKWLKSKNLIHMDIKPNNVCWGNNPMRPNLKLIDFGFVIPVLDTERHNVGTYNFADSSYFNKRIHSPSYDTFSAGLTLFHWLIQLYVSPEIIKQGDQMLLSYLLVDTLALHVPLNYLNILKHMIIADENYRITPEHIISLSTCEICPYVLNETHPVLTGQLIIDSNKYNKYEETKVYNHIIDCIKYSMCPYYPQKHVIKFLTKYSYSIVW